MKKFKILGASMALTSVLASIPVNAAEFLAGQANDFAEEYVMRNTDDNYLSVGEHPNSRNIGSKPANSADNSVPTEEWLITIGKWSNQEDSAEFFKELDDHAFVMGRLSPSNGVQNAREKLSKFNGKFLRIPKNAISIMFENNVEDLKDFYDQSWFRITNDFAPSYGAIMTPERTELEYAPKYDNSGPDENRPYIQDTLAHLGIEPILVTTSFVTTTNYDTNNLENPIYSIVSNQKDDTENREKAQKVINDFENMTDEEKTFTDKATNKQYKLTGKYKMTGEKVTDLRDSFQSTTELFDSLEFYSGPKSGVSFVFEVEEVESPKKVETIPFEVIYEDDDTLEEGKEEILTPGVNGEKVDGKVTKDPINQVVKRGTKKKEEPEKPKENTTKKIPFDTIYIDDDTLEKGKETVVTDGVDGESDSDGKVIKEPINKVVKRGTKEPVEELIDIPFQTILETDPTMPDGEERVVIEGVPGQKTKDGKVVKEPIHKVIKRGTKKAQDSTEIPYETEYVADPNLSYGERIVIQKGVNGEKDSNGSIKTSPIKEVIKVGTKETTETAPIKFETTYKINKSLKPFEEKVIQEGKDGLKTTTRTYVLDSKTGEVKENVVVKEEPSVNKIVEVGEEIAKIKELPSTGVGQTTIWVLVGAVVAAATSGFALYKKRKNNK